MPLIPFCFAVKKIRRGMKAAIEKNADKAREENKKRCDADGITP